MKKYFPLIVVLILTVTGCSSEEAPSSQSNKDHLFKDQQQALEKAKDVEQALQKAANERLKAIEEQTGK